MKAISMSVRQILRSKEIIAVVPDARKARAVKACLEGEISPMMPASILRKSYTAVVAVRLLELLDEGDLAVPEAAITAGLSGARWPARLDIVHAGDDRKVLVDGAHNPAGASALTGYIQSEWPAGLPIVFGAMGDKDLGGMLRPLAGVARPLIVTTAPGLRAAGAQHLAAVARSEGITDLEVCPDVGEALAAGWAHAPLIVAAGSLYLAGHVLTLLGQR